MVEKGLEGVIAATSSICSVDGFEGKLTYRGMDIRVLAGNSTFEEVVYFLWHDVLPTRAQLAELSAELKANRELPAPVLAAMRTWPKTANSMEVLRTAVSLLSFYDKDASDPSLEARIRISTRLTAQISTIVAAFERLHDGLEPIAPDPSLSHAANFLYMLNGERPSPTSERVFDVCLILHADHELNASTFSARVTVATLSDIYSGIVSAIGTLKGPLHGGANTAVMNMLLKIGSLENAESAIQLALANKQRIPGFGHRVYKTWDPRAMWLRKIAEELAESTGNDQWYRMSRKVEEIVWQEKQLYPNLDFYSASVYYTLGIPTDLFTPIFAVSRISGWTAHILEQLADNRLIRPRADYTGPVDQPYIPIDERKS